MSKKAPIEAPEVETREPGLYPCVFNPRGVSGPVCAATTKRIVHNRQGCMTSQCRSPQRLCITCLGQGVESFVDNPATGLCVEHVANPVANLKTYSKAGTVLALESAKTKKREVAEPTAETIEKAPSGLPEQPDPPPHNLEATRLFELVGQIVSLRTQGKNHKDVERHFNVSSSGQSWSQQRYALRYLGAEVREYILCAQTLPSINILLKVAYVPEREQLAYLHVLIREQEEALARARKVDARRTVAFALKLAAEVEDLKARVHRSLRDVENPEEIRREIARMLKLLQESLVLLE